MYRRIMSGFIMIAVLLAAFGPSGTAPASAASSIQTSNIFGYTWSSGDFNATWEDITGQPGVTKLTFPSYDIGYSETPISFGGWQFPFFENTYLEVYVDLNGMLMFTNPTDDERNQPIPMEVLPNDYIAPFWTDLKYDQYSPSAGIYALLSGTYPDRYLVVQWNQVEIFGGGGELYSFEVKMHETGKIEFIYQTMGTTLDQVTVGIEDSDGVDGLQIYYNQPGVTGSSNITIQRPTGNFRFKATRRYQAGFLQSGVSEFEYTLRNTGTISGKYTPSASLIQSNPNNPAYPWNVTFENGNTGLPLIDTNGDTKPDTGTVPAGAEFPLVVKVAPNFSPLAGNYALLDIPITAVGYPVTFTVRVQAAAPANFAQLFTDPQLKVNAEYIFSDEQIVRPVVGYYSGASQTMAGISETQYLTAWEKQEGGSSSNLQYVVMNALVPTSPTVKQFTSHGASVPYVADVSPSVDGASNLAALAFVRKEYTDVSPYDDYVSNIYVALIGVDAELLAGSNNPRKLTSNTVSRYQTNGREMADPRVVALDNGNFVVVWNEKNYFEEGNLTEDLWMAVIGSDNSLVMPPTQLTSSTYLQRYMYPTLAAMTGGKVLLAYGRRNDLSSTVELAYRYFTVFNGTVPPETVVSGTSVFLPDAVQIRPNGRVVVAWSNTLTNRIAYVVIKSDASTLIAGPLDVSSPDARTMDYVSVTRDNESHAILTWLDYDFEDYLYYALVDPDGNLATPSMPFRSGAGDSPTIFTSRISGGNAPLLLTKIYSIRMPAFFR